MIRCQHGRIPSNLGDMIDDSSIVKTELTPNNYHRSISFRSRMCMINMRSKITKTYQQNSKLSMSW